MSVVDVTMSYADARQNFLAAAERQRWERSSFLLSDLGPGGEELATNAAVSPAAADAPLLIVSSGLHGVEGPLGSAVQLAAFERWSNTSGVPSNVRVLFLHALNPYGFAYGRRFDAENIDPNRNCLRAGEAYSGAPPGYAELDALLNPQSPPSRFEPFRLKAIAAIARHGLPELQQAVAAGQYEFPRGLFYGGAQPGTTMQLFQSQLALWIAGARKIVHLDFHTGLGRWGTWKLLADHPLTSGQLAFARRWFGADAVAEHAADDSSYHARGGLGGWCHAALPDRDYSYFCAEFGTYGPVTMLSALRAENRAHHWGDKKSPETSRAKLRLREVFFPKDQRWQTKAVADGLSLVETALQGLAAEVPSA